MERGVGLDGDVGLAVIDAGGLAPGKVQVGVAGDSGPAHLLVDVEGVDVVDEDVDLGLGLDSSGSALSSRGSRPGGWTHSSSGA